VELGADETTVGGVAREGVGVVPLAVRGLALVNAGGVDENGESRTLLVADPEAPVARPCDGIGIGAVPEFVGGMIVEAAKDEAVEGGGGVIASVGTESMRAMRNPMRSSRATSKSTSRAASSIRTSVS
jgi:hypothetical protein